MRNLQNLLVKFQSGNAERWIEAAEQVRSWLSDDSDINFFEEPETEIGSPQGHAEEGEEEERTDDSDHSQTGDRDDPEGPEERRDYDYDDDEEHRNGGYGSIGGIGVHRARVAGRPSSSALPTRSAK